MSAEQTVVTCFAVAGVVDVRALIGKQQVVIRGNRELVGWAETPAGAKAMQIAKVCRTAVNTDGIGLEV